MTVWLNPPKFGQCDGSESSIYDCTPHGPNAASPSAHHGATSFAALDAHHCTHAIDLGAICFAEGQTTPNMKPEIQSCTNIQTGGGGAIQRGHDWTQYSDNGYSGTTGDQGIVFGCIEFYTAECQFDATNANDQLMTYR